jgi:hypothetical protein
MRGRVGLRARTDFDVVTRDGHMTARCRGIELSSSGILIDRGRAIRCTDKRLVIDLEMRLPERLCGLRARARSIWTCGTQQALRFVDISDVDRLSLAEHIDLQQLRGATLS